MSQVMCSFPEHFLWCLKSKRMFYHDSVLYHSVLTPFLPLDTKPTSAFLGCPQNISYIGLIQIRTSYHAWWLWLLRYFNSRTFLTPPPFPPSIWYQTLGLVKKLGRLPASVGWVWLSPGSGIWLLPIHYLCAGRPEVRVAGLITFWHGQTPPFL